jgi:BCCT family betaine/carnitine transporter
LKSGQFQTARLFFFGLATSLGFGAQQEDSGLEHVFGVLPNITVQVVLITVFFVIS